MAEGDNISDKCQLYYAAANLASDFLAAAAAAALPVNWPAITETVFFGTDTQHSPTQTVNTHALTLTLSWHKQSMTVGQSIINSELIFLVALLALQNNERCSETDR